MEAAISPIPTLPNNQAPVMMNIILDPNNRELSLLKYLYGYNSFQNGQLEAIQSILQGKDTLTLVPTDVTAVSKMTVQGLSTIQEKQKKVTVLLLIQFLLGSSANELKLLSLHVAAGFGMAKPYYKQKYGRRQLERLIYHLIGVGIRAGLTLRGARSIFSARGPCTPRPPK